VAMALLEEAETASAGDAAAASDWPAAAAAELSGATDAAGADMTSREQEGEVNAAVQRDEIEESVQTK